MAAEASAKKDGELFVARREKVEEEDMLLVGLKSSAELAASHIAVAQ